MTTVPETSRAYSEAQAQLRSIREMVEALRDAQNATTEDEDEDEIEAEDKIEAAIEAAEEAIREDPLEVSVRSDWHTPGEQTEDSEYLILLSTGGPAVRLTGDLNRSQPSDVRLEYQDWFTLWIKYPLDTDEEAACLYYARQFFFGE